MHRVSKLAVAVAGATALGAALHSAPPVAAQQRGSERGSPVTAFVDVTVVPMDTDRVVPHQTVLVRGDRITAIGPAAAIKVPASAARIDGRGKYLMPGLADMHTHLSRYSPERIDRTFLQLFVNGVTTVRDMEFLPKEFMPRQSAASQDMAAELYHNLGFDPYQVHIDGPAMLDIRRQIRAGQRLGPRLYLSAAWRRDSTKSVDDNLAAYRAAGYDHLKLYFEYEDTLLLDSLVRGVHRLGIPLVGHGFMGDFPRTLKLGLKSAEHLVPYTWARRPGGIGADSIAAAAAFAATAHAGLWNCHCPNYGPLEVVKGLHDAGAGFLLGTDFPAMPMETLHSSLENYVAAGFTPFEALLTGTRNVASYLGTLDSAGTVAVGKWADLLLLGANPLADVRNAAAIEGVMAGGHWLSRGELERRLTTVTRADLVGTWVKMETTSTGTTVKEFVVFQDDSTLKWVGILSSFPPTSKTDRWVLAGDTLWQGSANQTEADIRKALQAQKVMISNDTLRWAPYGIVDYWQKAFPGKPFPWSNYEATTYVRSTEPVP